MFALMMTLLQGSTRKAGFYGFDPLGLGKVEHLVSEQALK
jgi:hypothetical protein